MKKGNPKRSKKEIKGPLRLLDEMYINAMILLAISLALSLLVPLSALAVTLICGRGAETWYGGEVEEVIEVILASVTVSIGGSLLLDVAHKKDGER